MNKVSGYISDFSYIKEDASRVIIGYELKQTSDDMYEWLEVYLYKSQFNSIGINEIKDAINGDIDNQTDEKILCTYPWTVLHGDDAGKSIKVWLSKENQNNFKAKHDAALVYPDLVRFPMTYKISEDENKNAIYEVFESIQELAHFYLGGISYIQQCYEDGWARKGAIDWSEYEKFFNNE